MTRLRPLVLAAAALLLTGCSAVQSPTASVTGASFQGIDRDALKLNLSLNVANPNKVALPLKGTSYKMNIAGVDLLKGESKEDSSIPANGSKAVTVPVSIPFDSLLTIKDALVKTGGDIPYSFKGEVDVGMPQMLLGGKKLPVSYSGTIPLKQYIKDPFALMNSPKLRELASAMLTYFNK